ncbi:hypothetical protein CRG98_018788 [Punica granatum]|uniref:Uncharacterized protein n=1 Tax=Punica granatum TaxID=22663 RepID=A0A2I0JWV3_PUNGR|nr:hypothetical protein CRG98_018788 [Punica granatum]
MSRSEILAQCKPIGIHSLIQLYFVITRENVARIFLCIHSFICKDPRSVYPVPLDPGDSTALDLWVVNIGPRKGALSREHGRAGPGAGVGPNLRAKRVERSGPNTRRGGMGRIVSVGLGREDWAKSARLGGREWRFPPLCATTTAREGAGDGGERRLGYAVLGRGFTRLGSVGIERNFIFFGEVFRVSGEEFPSSIVGNWGN